MIACATTGATCCPVPEGLRLDGASCLAVVAASRCCRYCVSRCCSFVVRVAVCCAARLQLDQHPLLSRKDRHMSWPVSSVGGFVVPMRSFNFIADGTKLTRAGIGARLEILAPRPGGAFKPCPLAEVRPETMELTDALLEVDFDAVEDETLVATLPGRELGSV